MMLWMKCSETRDTSDDCDDAMLPQVQYVDIVERQKQEIQSIFVKYGLVRPCRDALLDFMRKLKSQTQEALPKSSQSLHLPLLKYTLYDVPQGGKLHILVFPMFSILQQSISLMQT